MAQAALGTAMEIETLDDKIKIHIPEGTQFGDTLTIKNHGVPDLRHKGHRGSLIIEFKVETPKKLSKEEKELISKLAQLRNEKIEHGSGIFSKIFGD